MSDQESQGQAKINVDGGSQSNTFQAGGNIEGNTFNIQQNIVQNVSGEREKVDHEPETILIPEGPFMMGIKAEDIKMLMATFGDDEDAYKNEAPQQQISLPAYSIGKFPVTNLQYKEFLDKTRGGQTLDPPQTLISRIMEWMGWKGSNIPNGKENFPVIGVTWYQALAYCQWLKRATGRDYQLPNEAQWEKACRGGNTFLYPWGNEFDESRCNYGKDQLAPADSSRPVQNEYGGVDFVGNIRQWTCSLWGANFLTPKANSYSYPWKNDPIDIQRRNDLGINSQIRRVVRGSSFDEEKRNLRCTIRRGELPEAWVAGVGFRVAIATQS